MAVNKRKLHHYWTQMRSVNSWAIVLLIVVFTFISVYALRQNNLRMVELRDNVLVVDKANGDIDGALRQLGNHIVNHMNTSMNRPVELVYSFNRDVEVARKKAESSTNSSIYRKAQTACENPSIPLTARAQCIQDYITDNARPGENPKPLEIPAKDLYTYDFAAPKWSADIAGLAMLIVAMLIFILFVRVISGIIIKRILKSRH